MKTFSIAVPAVNRPETLVHCLRTLLNQPGDDFEILVSDDQGPPENRQVVESLARPDLIRYLRTPQRLGMRGNYEFCVENSRGQYVTILGDDDGLCVGALKGARELLQGGQPDVLFWFPHLYWWPNALVKHKQWMLYIYANPKAAARVNAATISRSSSRKAGIPGCSNACLRFTTGLSASGCWRGSSSAPVASFPTKSQMSIPALRTH